MRRQRLSQRNTYQSHEGTPRTHKPKSEQPVISELRLAGAGLILSLIIISAKLYVANNEYIFQKNYITDEIVVTDGDIFYVHIWRTSVRYSNIWLPALLGLMATYFTGVMVYLDSDIPGVQPPSPFSPSKYRLRSGHTFHLNYMFAVLVGILVFSYTSSKRLTIEFCQE